MRYYTHLLFLLSIALTSGRRINQVKVDEYEIISYANITNNKNITIPLYDVGSSFEFVSLSP